MRDLDTMQLAISAAETGHLVFATLHTNSAATSVDRIVDGFPPGQQGQVRLQLSNNIQAIIAQQLIPRANGQGRVAVQEIMIATPAIRNLIREAKAHQITSAIQTSGNVGMITTDQALRDHYMRGNISYEAATSRAHNLDELKKDACHRCERRRLWRQRPRRISASSALKRTVLEQNPVITMEIGIVPENNTGNSRRLLA